MIAVICVAHPVCLPNDFHKLCHVHHSYSHSIISSYNSFVLSPELNLCFSGYKVSIKPNIPHCPIDLYPSIIKFKWYSAFSQSSSLVLLSYSLFIVIFSFQRRFCCFTCDEYSFSNCVIIKSDMPAIINYFFDFHIVYSFFVRLINDITIFQSFFCIVAICLQHYASPFPVCLHKLNDPFNGCAVFLYQIPKELSSTISAYSRVPRSMSIILFVLQIHLHAAIRTKP